MHETTGDPSTDAVDRSVYLSNPNGLPVPTATGENMNDGPPVVYAIPKDLLPLFMDNGTFHPDLWWWSFDTFVTQLVALAAQKIRDGSGYPCSHMVPGSGCNCQAEWYAYLEQIRDDLNSYDKFAWNATSEQYAKAQAAMHRFVDRMGSWWD